MTYWQSHGRVGSHEQSGLLIMMTYVISNVRIAQPKTMTVMSMMMESVRNGRYLSSDFIAKVRSACTLNFLQIFYA